MFIRKDNIRLRALEPQDAILLYQWENDREIWDVSETLVPFSMFQIEQFILEAADIFSAKQLRMMIDKVKEEERQKMTIGSIDLYDFDPKNKRAGVGIFIDKPFRKKGYAALALELCIDYAFDSLSLHQIYCYIAENNTASIRLFEKLGFEQCGIQKDWLLIKDRYVNQIQFQLLNPDH